MTLGELIDNVKNLFVEYGEERVNEFSTAIKEIRADLKNISVKVDTLQEKVDANNFREDINGISEKIGRIEFVINDGVQGELGNIKHKLDTLDTLNSNVAEILRIHNDELQRLKIFAEEVNVLRVKLEQAEAIINEREEKISGLNKNLLAAREKISATENLLAEKQRQLDEERRTSAYDKHSLRTQLDAERKAISGKNESLHAWLTAIEIYRPVRDALKNCSTFAKLLEKRGLNDDSDIGLFSFVQELGKTIDFVRDIYQTALDARRQQGLNAALLNDDEVAVYDAFNKFYRVIWNIDFDIFSTPGSRKSIAEPFEKTAFNKNEAIFLKDPRNRSLKFTEGIYVPMLLTREGKIYKQAYVDASNS